MRGDIVHWKLKNWAKYNPKTGAKSSTWARVNSDTWLDPTFAQLGPSGRLLMLYFITTGARRNGSGADLLLRLRSECSFRSLAALSQCLDHLHESNFIEYIVKKNLNDGGTKIANTNVTNVTNVTKRTLDRGCKKTAKITSEKTDGSKVFEAYASAYFGRYNQQPVRNAKTNALCSQLVKRLGAEDAPFVAAYYVDHPGSFYVRSMHQLDWLVKDAEKVCTEWKAGAHMTGIRANQIEERSHGQSVIQNILKNTKGPSDE